MSNLINLTPHTINIYRIEDTTADNRGCLILNEGAEPSMVLPSAGVLRATVESIHSGEVDGIPVYRNSYGRPVMSDGSYVTLNADDTYIVSALAAASLNAAADADGTDRPTNALVLNGTVRNAAGQIVGCTSLARV